MGKLYASLSVLVVLFALTMCFATLSVYEDQWWWGVVAAVIAVVVAGLGRALIPGTLRTLTGGRLRAAKVALQMVGSICGLLFFMMAIIAWALGKRSVGAGSAYTTLGLLIFLGLAGVGIQGALAMIAYFVHVRNQAVVAPARLEADRLQVALADGHGSDHGDAAGHSAELSVH